MARAAQRGPWLRHAIHVAMLHNARPGLERRDQKPFTAFLPDWLAAELRSERAEGRGQTAAAVTASAMDAAFGVAEPKRRRRKRRAKRSATP
ncbi:MAG: hypothetical protein AAF805_00220 [Planctomycetota bacterium]